MWTTFCWLLVGPITSNKQPTKNTKLMGALYSLRQALFIIYIIFFEIHFANCKDILLHLCFSPVLDLFFFKFEINTAVEFTVETAIHST